MSRARVIVVGAALALSVYAGATATDARVGTLTSAVHTVLQTDAQIEFEEIFYPSDNPLLDSVGILAFMLLLFGGLPVAVYGLVGHREWTRPADQRLRFVTVPYAVLVFQIVSVLCSGIWLVVLTPRVVTVLSLGIVDGHDLFLPSYLLVQFLAGIAAIPVWRRHIMHTSVRRYKLLSL